MEAKNEERKLKKWKQDFRIGSPQRVFRAVKDSIEELEYDFVKKPEKPGEKPGKEDMEELRLIGSPISDTATFREKLRGEKVLSKGCHPGYLFTGILLAGLGFILIVYGVAIKEFFALAGIIPLLLGIVFIAISSRVSKAFLEATIEGEAYKAMARMAEHEQELDVVADVRLTVEGDVDIYRGGTKIPHESAKDHDRKIIEADFAAMCDKLGAVLPAGRAAVSE